MFYPPETANFTALIEDNTAMTDQARNAAALLDMVKTMQTIGRFLTGRNFDDLINDELWQPPHRFVRGCGPLGSSTGHLSARTVLSKVANAIFQSAVERQLEILGEAANRVTDEFQAAHDDIAPVNVIGLRNIIIHQYDDIDYALLWEIVTDQVPLLLAQITPLVPPLPDG
ncbi:MAG: HepT-like ribonuclease domain-containing protein [Cyanobacteria bacterium P01_A01_bin.105]